MKMTPVLAKSFHILKESGELFKQETSHHRPYEYVPRKYKGMPFTTSQRFTFIDGTDLWKISVNSQSIGKLILMGYAEWTDKEKSGVRFIDKDNAVCPHCGMKLNEKREDE